MARAPCCQAPSPACLSAVGPCFWPVSLPSITPPPASSSFLSSVMVLMSSLEEVSLSNEAGLCEPEEPDVSQRQSSKPTHSHFRSLSEASHLLAQLLLCCFPPSARKTSFCASFPPSGLSTEGCFFCSATLSSLWTCSRKHREKRRRNVQKVATFGQRNRCRFYGRGALLVRVVGGTQNMGTGLELLPQLLSLLELGEKMNQEEDLACEGIQHLPEGEQEEFKSAFCI